MKNSNSNRRYILRLLVPTLVITLWFFVTQNGYVNRIILPHPVDVLTTIVTLFHTGRVSNDIAWTLLRTFLGFILGIITGVLLGTAMGTWRTIHALTDFSVDFLRSIPATTVFPIFMLILGLGLSSMVALIAFPCCWLVTINTMYGVRNSSLVRQEMATVFRLTKSKKFFHITLRDAMPSIAASLRLSVAICLHMAIIGEMFMGSQTGIGRRVYDAHTLLKIPEMYAFIILAGILGYILNQLFLVFERKLVFWGGQS